MIRRRAETGWRCGGATSILSLPNRILTSIRARIVKEYDNDAGGPKKNSYWHNTQLLRVICAYAIVYIHMAKVTSAASIDPKVVDILRFGTDLFVVLAGFLAAHVLGSKGKPAGVYLRNRLIRIVPSYWVFTILAFLVARYAMRNHPLTPYELLMSLAFVPNGPLPVLYPAWTLVVILEFSLIIAAFQVISTRFGLYCSALFAVLVVVFGKVSEIKNPTFQLYTNPILADFALGILVYKIAKAGIAFRLSRQAAIVIAAALLASSAVAVIARPFNWPEVPRLLALGLPMSLMLLGVTILEGRGICWESKLFNFWAKCTYAIYLTHWFAVIVADRIVAESGNSRAVAIALILLTPAVVTYVSVLVYVYFEAPLTRYLTDRFSKAVQRPS